MDDGPRPTMQKHLYLKYRLANLPPSVLITWAIMFHHCIKATLSGFEIKKPPSVDFLFLQIICIIFPMMLFFSFDFNLATVKMKKVMQALSSYLLILWFVAWNETSNFVHKLIFGTIIWQCLMDKNQFETNNNVIIIIY